MVKQSIQYEHVYKTVLRSCYQEQRATDTHIHTSIFNVGEDCDNFVASIPGAVNKTAIFMNSTAGLYNRHQILSYKTYYIASLQVNTMIK